MSKTKPLIKVNIYKVIHRNSAVSSKCRDVFTFIVILAKSIKNNKIIKFISPNVIRYIKGLICLPALVALLYKGYNVLVYLEIYKE